MTDSKSDQGIFLGLSVNIKAYRVYTNHTNTIMELINMVIYDDPHTMISDEEEKYMHRNGQNVTTEVHNKMS